MKTRLSGLILGFASSVLFAAGALADVEMYLGQEDFTVEGHATYFSNSWMETFYSYGGLDFEVTDSFFANYSCDGDMDGLYVYAGGQTMITVTRTDGENFTQLELQSGDGNPPYCEGVSFIWAAFYLDGTHIADFDFDNPHHGDYYGFIGVFDEMRIAAYPDAATRGEHNESNWSSIWLDDVRFGVPKFKLDITGDCPGLMSAEVVNATPGGMVAIAYSQVMGSTECLPVCPGVYLDISHAKLAGLTTAASDGKASLSGMVPAGACGNIMVQALDIETCTTSNVITAQ